MGTVKITTTLTTNTDDDTILDRIADIAEVAITDAISSEVSVTTSTMGRHVESYETVAE